ncbi:MAG: ABC transporter permease [Microthrixaceae bacterium]|nr:ABC transporter permease [Microthrixaceae bacterium]
MTAVVDPAATNRSSTSADKSRLRPSDVIRVAVGGLRARKLRAALSVLGISIGIASLVGVLGLSESSKSDLLDQLDVLGTNLLTVTPGEGFGVGDSTLPDTAVVMVRRLPTVEAVTAVAELSSGVYRNDLIPETETGALTVLAAESGLLDTLGGSMAQGRSLDAHADDYPVAVLGSVAAERLGIEDLGQPQLVYVGSRPVEVVGVMVPLPLAEDINRSVVVPRAAADAYLQDDLETTSMYLRTTEGAVLATRDILPATVDPQNPEEVEVTRPSDVLEAQAAAEGAFTSLFLGLGLVALVVGGIGIANVMVMGVIERRGEIGLRRSIGATRRHIRLQFLTESLVLGVIGGVLGVSLGAAVTAGYSAVEGWRIIVPLAAVVGGFVAAVAIGAVAGLYPAVRASRLAPN